MITATDSAAQKYATVFPEYFVKAMKEASSDRQERPHLDLRVFAAASPAVKQHYEQRGQLTTERALIDDNGDGKGREAEAEGPDGGLARIAFSMRRRLRDREPGARQPGQTPPRARGPGRRAQAAQGRDA